MSYMDRPYELRDQEPDYDDPERLYRREEKIDEYIRLVGKVFFRENPIVDRMKDLDARHERGEVTDLERGLEEDLILADTYAHTRARIEEVKNLPHWEDLDAVENPESHWRHQDAVDELIQKKSPEGVEEWAIELSMQGRIRQEDLERIQEQTHEARHGEDEEPEPAE